jgi:ferredoxin--NADP+ reductase
LRAFAALPRDDRPISLHFDFFARPVAIEGDGRVERLIIERTKLEDGRAVGTGELRSIACGLVVSCIGYLTPSIPGVPHDDRAGRFASNNGRIAPGLYAVGWAQHGPTGTIGTNRPDAFAIAEMIAADAAGGLVEAKSGRTGLDALIAARGIHTTCFNDWQAIDAAEKARANGEAPREKFVRTDEMLAAGKART